MCKRDVLNDAQPRDTAAAMADLKQAQERSAGGVVQGAMRRSDHPRMDGLYMDRSGPFERVMRCVCVAFHEYDATEHAVFQAMNTGQFFTQPLNVWGKSKSYIGQHVPG